MRTVALPVAWVTCVALACASPEAERDEASCYRSPESALLGPIVANSRQNGKGPGWIRIDGAAGSDSGAVELIDAEGARLRGLWRRASTDSVSIVAADDFLRVQLQLAIIGSVATGRALATSDADVERDSSGELRDFRREWILRAVRATCDSAPVPTIGQSRARSSPSPSSSRGAGLAPSPASPGTRPSLLRAD